MKYLTFIICFLFLVSPFIWAQQKVDLKFSHKLHVVENELECTDCHEAAVKSTKGTDNLLPDMDACGDCHDVEAENECTTCHKNPDEAQEVPRIENYSPLFSHQKHLQSGLKCQDCHQGVANAETIAEKHLPTMVTCTGCHEERTVYTDCYACHTRGEQLRPANHTADFLHQHGELAKNQAIAFSHGKTCNSCHKVSECQRCHEGDNLQRQTHPLNYEFTHALEAQLGEKNCFQCHQDRQFCIECHRDRQVMPQNHTVGWVNKIPGDGGQHRYEAENDLESCMACHEQDADQVCTKCHGEQER